MSFLSVNSATADSAVIGAASVQFTTINAMAAGQFFELVANADCWYSQGANPTATAGAGSIFLPARKSVIIDGALGAKIALIQDGASAGKASLARIKWVK